MTDKILSWMRGQCMTQPGDTVICAVSGGADSVCMLHVLLSLRNTLGITVEAAHFNHQLRSEESDRDEAFVRTLCAELGVVLHVDNGDVRARAAKTHESVEEAGACASLRVLLFPARFNCNGAHAGRQSGNGAFKSHTRHRLAGLCGIPPRRERFIRPMLAVSRAEIEVYLAQNGLSHVTDSTNFLPDARRNRLRQSVVPLLKAENPSLCETAFRMCRLLEADEAQLSAQAEAALRQARLSDGIRCSALTAYPAAVRTRAVKLLLGEIHAPKLSERHISAVDRLLFSECPSAHVSLPGRFTGAAGIRAGLLLTAGSPAAFKSRSRFWPGNPPFFSRSGLRVCCEWQENFSEIQNTLSTFAVKCDTIGSTTQILVPSAPGARRNARLRRPENAEKAHDRPQDPAEQAQPAPCGCGRAWNSRRLRDRRQP